MEPSRCGGSMPRPAPRPASERTEGRMRQLIGERSGRRGIPRIPRWRGSAVLGVLLSVAAVAPAVAAGPIAQRVLKPADIPGSRRATLPAKPLGLAAYVQ